MECSWKTVAWGKALFSGGAAKDGDAGHTSSYEWTDNDEKEVPQSATSTAATTTAAVAGEASAQVNDTDFVVTLGSGSSITVTSAERKEIAVTGGSFSSSFPCGDSSSTRALSYSGAGTVAVTVTPSQYSCSNATGGGGTPPQCLDYVDNDHDGQTDANDPGCHKDGDAGHTSSYEWTDNDEKEVPQSDNLHSRHNKAAVAGEASAQDGGIASPCASL
jgi:hypothetical protein